MSFWVRKSHVKMLKTFTISQFVVVSSISYPGRKGVLRRRHIGLKRRPLVPKEMSEYQNGKDLIVLGCRPSEHTEESEKHYVKL